MRERLATRRPATDAVAIAASLRLRASRRRAEAPSAILIVVVRAGLTENDRDPRVSALRVLVAGRDSASRPPHVAVVPAAATQRSLSATR